MIQNAQWIFRRSQEEGRGEGVILNYFKNNVEVKYKLHYFIFN